MNENEALKLINNCANFIQPYDDGGNEATVLMERIESILKKESDDKDSLIADIRNKLSPANNLCAMLKDSGLKYHNNPDIHILIKKEIERVEKSIEYLSNL